MSGWYLEEISVEGFRGINNEGNPFKISFKPDHVNSVSAQNGIGKTSIYDAVSYAITGGIPKLDKLPNSERAANYYLNRFHPASVGTVSLTLLSDDGATSTVVTVQRDSDGNRVVSATGGVDGEATLSDLNREFVLLDGPTFQDFIDLSPQNRGRSFSGLLGLKRYSMLRQSLSAIANTTTFNNHFRVVLKKEILTQNTARARSASSSLREAYKVLTGEEIAAGQSSDDVLAKAHRALAEIPILAKICEGRTFEEVDPSVCVAAAKEAEDSKSHEKLAALIRDLAALQKAVAAVPDGGSVTKLLSLAKGRDDALAKTQGDIFHQLFTIGKTIVSDESWHDKTICPACDRAGDNSVVDVFDEKLSAFDSVANMSKELASEWQAGTWGQLAPLENLACEPDEVKLFAVHERKGADGDISEAKLQQLVEWIKLLTERANNKIKELSSEKSELESKLPDRLTVVVEKSEAARRMQSELINYRMAKGIIKATEDELSRIERVRGFLNYAKDKFSASEAEAGTRRLSAIEPKMREMFSAIMFEEIVPALTKKPGSEELSISLAQFWSLQNISARAVLSESFRNAFAISVYLAAASLYGGGAKFLILDDITSSFDSGHQVHLMEVIRRQFGRPEVLDGPQVILLSHDTALEKFFTRNTTDHDWWHQSISGNAVTSLVAQNETSDKLRTEIMDLLRLGKLSDVGYRLRHYLEFKLNEVISKVKIPVPVNIVFNDDKRMVGSLISAIEAAIELNEKAGQLILDQQQKNNVTVTVAAIVGNFVAHWSTGQTHMFTAGALRGVVVAIDDFAKCFQYEKPAGSGKFEYYKNLSSK